jgi:NAD(P)H-dependent FMN reductase
MKILGISGSLQGRSSNTALLRHADEVSPWGVEFAIFDGIGGLPHYNPELDDLDGGIAPPQVLDLRNQLRESHGVLFATPEYAHGMPGVLKNALDWLVGSGELAGKPVAVLSASPNSSGGIRAQVALIQTLVVMDAVFVDALAVPFARKKLDDRGKILHEPTLRRIQGLVRALAESAGAA